MSLNTLKAYISVIGGGIVLVAATILVVSNLGVLSVNKLTFYWTQIPNVSLGMLMIMSAIGGAVIFPLIKYFIRGCLNLYKIRRKNDKVQKEKEKIASQAIKMQQKLDEENKNSQTSADSEPAKAEPANSADIENKPESDSQTAINDSENADEL